MQVYFPYNAEWPQFTIEHFINVIAARIFYTQGVPI